MSRPEAPRDERDLFEQWMGLTVEEWEALGATDEEATEEQPRLI